MIDYLQKRRLLKQSQQKKGTDNPVSCAIFTARGVIATTVPTEVPIAIEIKHVATNMPGTIIKEGSTFNVMFTVASTAPVFSAIAAKEPASMKIHIIYSTFTEPASLEKISILCDNDNFLSKVRIAHTEDTNMATLNGIL